MTLVPTGLAARDLLNAGKTVGVAGVIVFLVLAAFLLLVGFGLARWWRAIALARRPQRVRYDHSWLTNILGETSTPHDQDPPEGPPST